MKQLLTDMRALVKHLVNDSLDTSYPELPSIDPDYDLTVSDSDIEVLKILDKLSSLYSRSHKKICSERLTFLEEALCIGVAKVDYALIEKGRDLGKMIHELHKDYYVRERDIEKSGHTRALIDYFLIQETIEGRTGKPDREFDSTVQRDDFSYTAEFSDALSYGLCDDCGRLLVGKATYTRFAVVKYSINLNYQRYWMRFHNIFLDCKGKAISYKDFLQSSRDQGFEKIKEKVELEFPELKSQ